MKVIRNGSNFAGRGIKAPVVTLGNFDGIHLGHRLILEKVRERARFFDSPSVVYTFDPHPLKVVAPEKSPPLIMDLEDKEALFETFGIDYLVLARFTREFAARHPGEFVEDVLVRGLGVREVLVGEGFSFGRGRSGNVEFLKTSGRKHGFSVHAVQPVRMDGEVVSSSRIRRLLAEGEVRKAAMLLGRPYSVKGVVVPGSRIGRQLGFPTANIDVESELVPAGGVYAVYGSFDGDRIRGVVNIGTAPTFGERKKALEVHLLDFEATVYGKRIRVEFIERLRDERAFSSREALARQIKRDTERARLLFSSSRA